MGVRVGAGVAGAGVNVARGGNVAKGVTVGMIRTDVGSGGGVINCPQAPNKTSSVIKTTIRFRIGAHYTTAPKQGE